MQRVGILVHPTRSVGGAVEIIRQWVEDRGLELVQIPSGAQPRVAPPGEVDGCDLITAVGGDGTVLKGLHAAARTGTPVLGVACGSLGALTAVPASELRAGLDRFAANAWHAEHLPALEVSTAEGHLASAINDLVLARKGGTQLIVGAYVDDELYVRLAGDGIVVATPLGSSAYSMAAGGPLLDTGANAVVCTPVAMHGGSAAPLVLPDDSVVRLDVHPGHGGYSVEIDGFELESVGERFTVTTRRTYTTLVELDSPRGRLRRLRERGLISDSPRLSLQRTDR